MNIPQESDRISGRTVSWVAVVSGATIVVTLFVVRMLVVARPAPKEFRPGSTIEDDALGLSLHREQEKKLHGYGWVDRQKGVAHIPIERAIDLELEASP